MEVPARILSTLSSVLVLCFFLVMLSIRADVSDAASVREVNLFNEAFDCEESNHGKEDFQKTHSPAAKNGDHPDDKNIDIIVAYSDSAGTIQTSTVKSRDLSSSWVWENPDEHINNYEAFEIPPQLEPIKEDKAKISTDERHSGEGVSHHLQVESNPVKLQRKVLRQQRRDQRTAELIQQGKEADDQLQEAAIIRAREFKSTPQAKYSIWRRDNENTNSDSLLRLMRDQIIMAKVYASFAKSMNETDLYNSLISHSKKSRHAIGEAGSDAELHSSALDRAKVMGHVISLAKDRFYDCPIMARRLRAMIQTAEDNVIAQKKLSAFLTQLAAKVVPKPLHCLSLHLTTDYFLLDYEGKGFTNKDRLEDPSLYHYAIFSDNVLATSVVVNSTALHAKEPEKHVFHIVTDRLNFAAMKMWFMVNSPPQSAIQVANIDDFKWLNSSYCSVLRQLESARLKEYYFKVNHPSTLSAGSENLKYRNPKYLSMLNHLRFYLPEVYPKLEKILFLDDDIVVRKDLTPLWSVDLKGMVNGAVETCKQSFHTFDKYLNFSHPLIRKNFDPNACGWAFGMNIFDLKEWRKRDITGIYHHWQDRNEERMLWKLGSLPPGLISFYNLTYPLDRSWHVLGLGYDATLNQTELDIAAVLHYNGNNKPWLELALSKYKQYWTEYLMFDNTYLQRCHIMR